MAVKKEDVIAYLEKANMMEVSELISDIEENLVFLHRRLLLLLLRLQLVMVVRLKLNQSLMLFLLLLVSRK